MMHGIRTTNARFEMKSGSPSSNSQAAGTPPTHGHVIGTTPTHSHVGTPPNHGHISGTPPHHGYLPGAPHHHRGRYTEQRHEMYSIESGSTTGYASSHHGTVTEQHRSASHTALDDKDFKDNLAMSVFTMLCCCCPLGILAFVNSRDARRHFKDGRLHHAYEAAYESRRYSVWAMGVGVVIFVLLLMTVIIVLSYTLR